MTEAYFPESVGEYLIEESLQRAEREVRAKIARDFEAASANKLLQVTPKRARALARKVESELSSRIYADPGQLRRFADQVRTGALGRFMSWVYFIGERPEGPVKIGVSRNPQLRITGLQVGSHAELELLCTVRGDATIEAIMHSAFAPDHIRGEWFRRSATLKEFMLQAKPRRLRKR